MISSDRLDLILVSPQVIDALLEGRRGDAEHELDASIPEDWPDEHDAMSCLGIEAGYKADERGTSVWVIAVANLDLAEHVRQRLARIGAPQAVYVRIGADRIGDRRPLALDEIEGEPHRLERNQQIGEQDLGVQIDSG